MLQYLTLGYLREPFFKHFDFCEKTHDMKKRSINNAFALATHKTASLLILVFDKLPFFIVTGNPPLLVFTSLIVEVSHKLSVFF